jgi:regulator of protease activity HflC (stomatin/prohibitin superfamily)
MMIDIGFGLLIAIAIPILYLLSSIRIVKEYERGVMFFFGRFSGIKGPGLRFVFRPVYRMEVLELRTIAEDVPAQDVITRDNVSARVNAVIYFRVIDPERAVLQIEDYRYATSQLAQTSLRSVVGAHVLDSLLSEREELNRKLQGMLDEQTDPWGIKVSAVEIKHVELPAEMRRAIARQAEAERERRAKIIAAEAELQAADKLTEAARTLATQPMTVQLRYLQTLVEISSEQTKLMVFPLPIEILTALGYTREDRTAASEGYEGGTGPGPGPRTTHH